MQETTNFGGVDMLSAGDLVNMGFSRAIAY